MKFFRYFIYVLFIFSLVKCTKEGAAGPGSQTGQGGSLARFTIVGNHLYMADQYSLNSFDISDPANPVFKSRQNLSAVVETIFPFKGNLFIGSATGMFIYSLSNPDVPVSQSIVRHFRSCDPVVANDTVAYVTLRGDNRCGPATSGLYTYDIRNISNPVHTAIRELSNPYGLGLKDSIVFVCRGYEGLTAVNVKNPSAPKDLYTIKDANYLDVIPYGEVLICYVSNGIILYDLSNLKQIRKIGALTY